MRRRAAAAALLALACGAAIAAWVIVCAQGRSSVRLPVVKGSEVTRVVWFAGKESHGLRQDSAGNLVFSHHRLPIQGGLPELYAAICHPGARALVTVDENAVSRLYERAGTSLRLTSTRLVRRDLSAWSSHRLWPLAVRFCRVPGLVYLTYTPRDPYDPNGNLVQIQTVFTQRIALGTRAHCWHAVETDEPGVWPSSVFLRCTYRVPSPTSLHLSMPDGEKIVLRLPGPLTPRRNYYHPEPVFVFPGRAVICKTRDGWSLHDSKGRLVRFFSFGRLDRRLGWAPFYRGEHFYVPVEGGKHIDYYRMDVSTGKLVDVGHARPQ